ncbi:hypothetical protein [Paenibacillus sp. NAIST15-1]|uniref:hypothetical protein n=1 Tax=Paenibacillus sp. NAIST15-1 TaxID=1605994 RepID=UPI00086ED508|nr:hypothetical protein [Paenibacillus sp. NAIST15-1]GAV11400.1 hypothetical protein PBN151_1329 [Paenibacillus sp. NAIST15-1]
MNFDLVYLEPLSIHAYRRPDCGIPLVTGVYFIEPDEHLEGRLCYEVTYEDGYKDYVTKSDVDEGKYRFLVK